jgi:hypothetical protein
MSPPISARRIHSIRRRSRLQRLGFEKDTKQSECRRSSARIAGMKWSLALAALVLLGPPPEAHAARRGSSKFPRCLQSMESSTALTEYVTYLKGHSNVLSAFAPCRLPTAVLDSFVSQLETAEITGVAPSAALPEAYFTKEVGRNWLNITQEEGIEIVSAKLAHILFLEVRGLVPWLLADYDGEALDSLFDVCKQLGCSFSRKSKTTGFRFQYLVDHSPREPWTFLNEMIDVDALTDPTSGLEAILTHTQQFRHGGANLDPDLGIVTVNEMAAEKVSRRGCWSTSPYVVSLAAALNIPGRLTEGYFAGQGHQTALFEAVDGVLAHGDDVYAGSLRNTPVDQLLDSYQRWADEVLRYDPFEGPLSPAGYNSRIHHYELARRFPSHWTMSRYCGYDTPVDSGRDFLESFFGDFATAEELDGLERRIVATTGSCALIPRDGP